MGIYFNTTMSDFIDLTDEQKTRIFTQTGVRVETPDIVYHPRRVKVTIAGRTKVTHPRRAKVTHL